MTQPKARISPKVRKAIRLMVEEGRSRSDAAAACGITDDWLYRALLRPDCLALRNSLMGALRTSEASRTISRVAKLADEADSEHVRLESNKWLGGLEGVAPVARHEIAHTHKHLLPGLTIITGGWEPHLDVGQALPSPALPAPRIKMIGTPRPHPLAVRSEGEE